MQDFREFPERQDHFFERNVQRQDLTNAIRVGNDLAARLRQMQDQRERWTDEQVEKVSKRIERTRGTVAAMFDDWLPQQSCLSLERVDSFRDMMVKYAAGNLKALCLDELAQKVERRASEIIVDMKERQTRNIFRPRQPPRA